MALARLLFMSLFVSILTVYYVSSTPFTWMKRDRWDQVNEMFSNVSAQNCKSKSKEELFLPRSTIAGVPKYNQLLSTRIYTNRSQLLHLHNMALNRAFFYSLIYQRLNQTTNFRQQPGLMYLYLSASADVSASPGWVNGTGLHYNENCSYPNWFNSLPFNTTIPFFAPISWREDDYNEPTNFLREPTNTTIDIVDLGTGNSRNYLNSRYKGNPSLDFWLPDSDKSEDGTRKFAYSVNIMYSNETGNFVNDVFEEFAFFGPPQPSATDPDDRLPVRISRPFFDCGRTNRWLVSASSPVVEYMPRYLENFIHLGRPKYTAVSVVNIEFERLDMNQCPLGDGNIKPNIFAGTHRCRDTTMCEPLSGYGFRRGGYQCVCNPGYYYPWWHDGPFMGREIEEATKEEWELGFDCLSVQDRRVIPTIDPKIIRAKRSVSVVDPYEKFLSDIGASTQSSRISGRVKRSFISRMSELTEELRQKREAEAASPKLNRKKRLVAKNPPLSMTASSHKRHKREAVDEESVARMTKIMKRFRETNKLSCKYKKPYELFLPGDAGFGAHKQFEAQGRTALRLAHFLSAFLQNVDEFEEFGDLRGDRRIDETQMFAEVIANVMADWKIVGSGIYFDRYKFRMSPPINNTDPRFIDGITREFFGPYGFRVLTTGVGSIGGADAFSAMDMAGRKKFYTDEQWFRDMKARWATNFVALKRYSAKPMIRSNYAGDSNVRFIFYPLTYRAVNYEDGEWLRPQFKCDGRVDSWVVTYLAPFFGKDDIKQDIEFKGVVSVEVDLNELTIDQCPAPFHVANAFKNTARCDYETQRCAPSKGYGHTSNYFVSGLYKCECREGFEYPMNDLSWYFDGSTMETEFVKFMRGVPNKFETQRCRKAGASSVSPSLVLFVLLSFGGLLLNWRL